MTNFFRNFFHRPQQMLLRRALFQIHLWAGLIIGLYLIAVCLTGSILVFKEEAVNSLLPKLDRPVNPGAPRVEVGAVVNNLRAAYPRDYIAIVSLPTESKPAYHAVAMRQEGSWGSKIMITVAPETGKVVGDVNLTKSWLGFFHNLHIVLLMGQSGFIANGVGAFILLLVSLTGLVLWWPGAKSWKRGFTVDFSKSWKRVNWDLHNTIGFYTLAIVAFWAVSTIYFVWEDKFTAMVNTFSHVSRAEARKFATPAKTPEEKKHRADLQSLIARAEALTPGSKPLAIMLPRNEKAPLTVYLTRSEIITDAAEPPSDVDKVYFDPYNGNPLGSESVAPNHTVGDWIIWSMVPLHFGTQWGFTVKIIWAVLGLSIPILTITSFLMYWNRYLSKKWRQLQERSRRPAKLATEISN